MITFEKNLILFPFFKKKPTLQSMIPKGYIDIHNHVLPGIDDGAADVPTSMQLLSSMHKIGIEKCIATPHTLHGVWNNTTESIQNAYQVVQPSLGQLHQTRIIQAASEYMIDNSLMDRVQQKIPLLTLKDRWVLLEMSYQSAPLGLFEIIFELQLQGYDIVLAHPERYYFYHSHFSMYEKLKQARIKFQLNLLSVTGYYGKDVANVAEQLLKAGMIDFTGTDIHHLRHVSYFNEPIIIKSISHIETALNQNQFFGEILV